VENTNGIKRTLNTVELISESISPQSLEGIENRQVHKTTHFARLHLLGNQAINEHYFNQPVGLEG
jgi:hypothetical protein